MSSIDKDQNALNEKFELLSQKYNDALQQDLEFSSLKIIYLELKAIKAKLTQLENDAEASN